MDEKEKSLRDKREELIKQKLCLDADIRELEQREKEIAWNKKVEGIKIVEGKINEVLTMCPTYIRLGKPSKRIRYGDRERVPMIINENSSVGHMVYDEETAYPAYDWRYVVFANPLNKHASFNSVDIKDYCVPIERVNTPKLRNILIAKCKSFLKERLDQKTEMAKSTYLDLVGYETRVYKGCLEGLDHLSLPEQDQEQNFILPEMPSE